MRLGFKLCFLMAVLLLIPSVCRADDPKAIIDKAIAAQGGSAFEKANQKAISWKDKGKVYVNGLEIDFTSKTVRVLPDRMRREIDAEVNGNTMKFVMAANAKDSWRSMNDAIMELGDQGQQSMKNDLYFDRVCQLTPLSGSE